MENHTPIISVGTLPYPRQTPYSVSVPKAFAVLCTVLIGTGGAYTLNRFNEWQPYLKHRVSFVFNAAEKPSHLDLRTAAEHIENIRTTLNPVVSDLAAFFDVSRQAVYKWQSGESIPEKDKLEKIIQLSGIADAFHIAKVSRPGDLLKMKAFNGRSLMDLIKAGESNDRHLQALIDESKMMEDSYKQSGIAASKAHPTTDWQSSFSIPGSLEQS